MKDYEVKRLFTDDVSVNKNILSRDIRSIAITSNDILFIGGSATNPIDVIEIKSLTRIGKWLRDILSLYSIFLHHMHYNDILLGFLVESIQTLCISLNEAIETIFAGLWSGKIVCYKIGPFLKGETNLGKRKSF